MTQVHARKPRTREEEVVEVEEATVEVDLTKTDDLLDRIEDVLEDQEKIEFKEKLRRWAANQRRLSPIVEMYQRSGLDQLELYGKALESGDNGNCPCCGWPLAGPPGPECRVRLLEG